MIVSKRLFVLILAIVFSWLILLTGNSGNKNDNKQEIVNQYNVSGFSTDFTNIVDNNISSVVSIDADKTISSGFAYKQVDNYEYIICTYHGVADARSINVVFDSGYNANASVVGYDAYCDIAVLQVEVPFTVKDVKIGDASRSKAGEFVICIGTPNSLDYANSIEMGMVSSPLVCVDNEIIYNGTKISYYTNLLGLTANLENGYSGSPIINMNSEVIAILTMKYNDDCCFALPINEAIIVAEKIINNEEYSKIQLGIKGTFISKMKNYEKTNLNIPIDTINGLYVEKVRPSSLCDLSGIKAKDIILSINNIAINDYNSELNICYSKASTCEFKVLRNNEELTLIGTIND